VGPAEDVMHEIVALFRDVFEFVMESNWSYEKHLEFYHSFKFEEMSTKEDLMPFHQVLFGCPAFEDLNSNSPNANDKVIRL